MAVAGHVSGVDHAEGTHDPAPLFRPARRNGATVFLDLETLEPHKDQWAYLSTLGRMTPQELRRAADRAGKVAVAAEVTRLVTPSSTKTLPQAGPVLRARLGAGVRVEQTELTPGLAATLRHAASMHNPVFYERTSGGPGSPNSSGSRPGSSAAAGRSCAALST
jgi:hypothetical protein